MHLIVYPNVHVINYCIWICMCTYRYMCSISSRWIDMAHLGAIFLRYSWHPMTIKNHDVTGLSSGFDGIFNIYIYHLLSQALSVLFWQSNMVCWRPPKYRSSSPVKPLFSSMIVPFSIRNQLVYWTSQPCLKKNRILLDAYLGWHQPPHGPWLQISKELPSDDSECWVAAQQCNLEIQNK